MTPGTDPRQYQYDPMLHGGYGISGYGDYSHYPAPSSPHQTPVPHQQPLMGKDETDYYPQPQTQVYANNGDAYTLVQKPRKRMDHIGKLKNKQYFKSICVCIHIYTEIRYFRCLVTITMFTPCRRVQCKRYARPVHGAPPPGPQHAATRPKHAPANGQQTTDLLRRVSRVRIFNTELS